MKQAKNFALVYLACAGATVPACSNFVGDVTATVMNVKGDVQIKATNSHRFDKLAAGTQPSRGDVIITGEEARLRLALLPNTLVQLRERSELHIVQLRIAKDGEEITRELTERTVVVRLGFGRFYALHEQRDRARTQFIVVTRDGELITEHSCLFRIDVDEGRTRVTCARGTANFFPSGKPPDVVHEGEVGRWPSEIGQNVMPATDERATEEVKTALRIENDLLVGRSRLRNVLPLNHYLTTLPAL